MKRLRMGASKWVIPIILFLATFTAANGQTCNPKYVKGNECANEAIEFTANSPGFTSDVTWEFKDASNNLVGTSKIRDPLFTFKKPGTYTVVFNGKGAAGTCSETITIEIKPSPTPDLVLLSPKQQCFNGNQFCFVDNSEPAPGSKIVRRTILFGDGGIYHFSDPQKGDTFCHHVEDARGGWFNAKLELEDANGCVTEYYLDSAIRVFPNLGVRISSNSPTKCDSTLATITNHTYVNWQANPDKFIGLEDVAQFVFNFGDKDTIFGDSVTNTAYWTGEALDGKIKKWYRTHGTFNATLSVTSRFGCSEEFIYKAAATNIKLQPKIISDKDSTCTGEPTICFKLQDGPIPGATFLWNFGHPQSGPLNTNDKTWTPCHDYGGGPYMASLRIWSGPCFIVVFDTNVVVGPQSVIEITDERILEKEKYQCVITDSVHLVNHSKFYHDDPSIWDEDSTVTSFGKSFRVVTHPVSGKDSIYFYSNRRQKSNNRDTLKGKYGIDDILNIGSNKVYFDKGIDSFVVVSSSGDTTKYPRTLGGVYPQLHFVFEWFANNTGSQVVYERANQMRNKDYVDRLWTLGDNYAAQCTTDTKANRNVDLNCNYSKDSLPVHWYTPWDSIYRYYQNGQFYTTPAPRTMFSRNKRTCYQVSVYPDYKVRVPQEVVLFVPKDSTKAFDIAYTDHNGNSLKDTVTIEAGKTYPEAQHRKTYRLRIWRPNTVYRGPVASTVIWEDQEYYIPDGVTVRIKNLNNKKYRTVTGPKTETIKKDEEFEVAAGDSIISVATKVVNAAKEITASPSTFIIDTTINGKDTTVTRNQIVVDPAYHRSYFFKNRANCNTVTLWHQDTIHDYMCEHSQSLNLALIPPSAKGLKINSGIPCPLDGNKLQYYLEFDMGETKPGCTQQWFEVNYDSLTGPMNWLNYKSGSIFAPPAPGVATPFTADYGKIGQWGTKFVKGYSSGEIGSDPKKRPNGSFTIGLVVGNGQPRYDMDGNLIAPECTDTAWYSDMFRYQYLDAQFDILIPKTNIASASMCEGETAYFRMVNPIQDSIAALRWNWGYSDRLSAYYEQFQYFQEYKGPVKGRNDENINWKPGDKWLYNYVVRHNLDQLYGDETIDTIVTRIYRDWTFEVNTFGANDEMRKLFRQIGLDIADLSGEDIALMLGDGTYGCVDTTGLSDYFEIGKIGINNNVVTHGEFKYQYTDNLKSDSIIIEQVLHFRDSSIQGFDTLIAPYDIEATDTVFKQGTAIPGVYKFTYQHPEVRLNFCDPTKKDTVLVNSNGPMYPGIYLNNTKGCEKSAAKQLNVGYFNQFKLVEEAVCEDQVHRLRDSIRYWQDGDFQFPDQYPLDPTPYWDDKDRYLAGDKEIKAVDWNYGDGVDKFDRSLTFFHEYDTPGEYLIAVATEDTMGCKDTTFVTAFVTGALANFETNLNAGGDICDGIVSFFDSSVVFDPCRGRDTCPNGVYEACDSVVQYEWDFGDGSVTSVLKNPSHDYTSRGWFTVKLKIWTLLGCEDSIEKKIFIRGPQPRFEFAGGSVWGEDSIVICVGDSARLANTSISPMNDPSWIVYWGDSANSTSSSKNINELFTHQYNEEGVYYLYMFMEDEVESGKPPCTQMFPDTSSKDGKIPRKIKVVVRPVAQANLEISDTVVCPDQLVTFTSNSDTIYKYYQWSFGDGDTATRSNPTNFVTHSYRAPGTYKVNLIPNYDLAPGDFGPKCIDIDSGEVTVMDVKAAFDVIDKDRPEFCFTNKSEGGNSYEWLIENENRSITTMNTSSLDESICYNWGEHVGTYEVCLVATSSIGCTDTVCHPIENDFRIVFVPYNVFTPDEKDALNREFVIDIEGWESFDINIYNRWGELVFKSIDPTISWDGSIMNKGEKCPEGTYFYVINYKLKNRQENDGKEPVSGTVTLIR